jgi:hypothetical protein
MDSFNNSEFLMSEEIRATCVKQFLVAPDLAWMGREQGEGHEFFHDATQGKNIWVLMGE